MTRERSRRKSHDRAITVRLVAFLVGALGMIAVPATLVAASIGQLTSQTALLAIGGAAALVLVATLAAQSVDPLRG